MGSLNGIADRIVIDRGKRSAKEHSKRAQQESTTADQSQRSELQIDGPLISQSR